MLRSPKKIAVLVAIACLLVLISACFSFLFFCEKLITEQCNVVGNKIVFSDVQKQFKEIGENKEQVEASATTVKGIYLKQPNGKILLINEYEYTSMAVWGDFIFYNIYKDEMSSVVAKNVKTNEDKILFSTEKGKNFEAYGLEILNDKLYFAVGDGLKGVAGYVLKLPPDSPAKEFSNEGYHLTEDGSPLVYNSFGDACFSWGNFGWLDSEKDEVRKIVHFNYECGDGSVSIGHNARYIYGADYKSYGLGDAGLSSEDGEFIENIYRINISNGKKTFLAKNVFDSKFSSAQYSSDGQDAIFLTSKDGVSSNYQLLLESGEIVAVSADENVKASAVERRPDWEDIDLPEGYSLEFLQ